MYIFYWKLNTMIAGRKKIRFALDCIAFVGLKRNKEKFVCSLLKYTNSNVFSMHTHVMANDAGILCRPHCLNYTLMGLENMPKQEHPHFIFKKKDILRLIWPWDTSFHIFRQQNTNKTDEFYKNLHLNIQCFYIHILRKEQYLFTTFVCCVHQSICSIILLVGLIWMI